MKIQLLAFAQTADQLGFRERTIQCTADETLRALLGRIAPDLDLQRLRVAVDEEYRSWDEAVGPGQVVALIPPVSGG